MKPIQISEPNRIKQKAGIAVGIDLGTTNSLIAIFQDGRPNIIGEALPSTLANIGGRLIVGNKKSGYISSIKRLMGKNLAEINTLSDVARYDLQMSINALPRVTVGDKHLTPEEISAEILKYLLKQAKDNLNQDITEAVITVPAYFNESQRQATKNAARLAGVEVLRLLNEPTAAAVAYNLDNKSKGKFAVYDLGGGTFDISILNLQSGIFQVLATKGDTNFGGDDIDTLLLENMLKQIGHKMPSNVEQVNYLLMEMCQIKEQLTLQDSVFKNIIVSNKEYSFSLTRTEFDEIIASKVINTLNMLDISIKDAGLKASELEAIILVGGSTRIPLIEKMLAKRYNVTIYNQLNPDTIVAQGAAIQANNLTVGGGDLLLDVVPLSLGIETYGGIFERIISKNSPMPTAVTKNFTTKKDNQTSMAVHVLQGEREMASDCQSIAKFILYDIPPMLAGCANVAITFKIDVDGLLTCAAEEISSGCKQSIEVKPSHGLTADKIDEMLQNAYSNAQKDLLTRKLNEAKLGAESFIESLEQLINEENTALNQDEFEDITNKIDHVKQVILTGDLDTIVVATDNLRQDIEHFTAKLIDKKVSRAIIGKNISDIYQKIMK